MEHKNCIIIGGEVVPLSEKQVSAWTPTVENLWEPKEEMALMRPLLFVKCPNCGYEFTTTSETLLKDHVFCGRCGNQNILKKGV